MILSIESFQCQVPAVHAPQALEPALDMVLGYFRQCLAAGLGFRDGELVDIGWMRFRVDAGPNGIQEVRAPLFKSTPMVFVDDCSTAMNLMVAQRYLLESFGAESGPCHCTQQALAVNDLASCERWYMDRIEPAGAESSGWFFGGHESALDPSNPENLHYVPLWDLVTARPYVAPFLLLPTGWQVSFEERPIVMYQREPVAPFPRSFYTRQYGVG